MWLLGFFSLPPNRKGVIRKGQERNSKRAWPKYATFLWDLLEQHQANKDSSNDLEKIFKFNMIEFKPNELEVDVGVRSVQNDEHLAELGKVTKEFKARMEAGN